MKLEMVSNATLMMRESSFREQLLRCLELVTFSMDGATRQTYNSVRTGAEFDEVVDNITRFADRRLQMPVDARPKMNFNYILMRRTVAEAPKFVEMVHRWGGDHIVFNHLVTFHPSLKDESLNYDRAYANEWQDRTREVAQALGVSISMPPNFTELEPSGSNAAPNAAGAPPAPAARPCSKPPIKCWFLWQRVYIAPFGDVVPCCLAGMPNFGNLRNESFGAIWNGTTYQQYRQHVFTERPLGKCKSCYLIYPNAELAGAGGFEY
jgi:radical SAM protein with 4Fe4S-binding SPASM domain